MFSPGNEQTVDDCSYRQQHMLNRRQGLGLHCSAAMPIFLKTTASERNASPLIPFQTHAGESESSKAGAPCRQPAVAVVYFHNTKTSDGHTRLDFYRL